MLDSIYIYYKITLKITPVLEGLLCFLLKLSTI